MTPIRTWLLCFEHLSRKKEDFAWIDTHRFTIHRMNSGVQWSKVIWVSPTGLEIWPCSFTTARVSFPLATHCCEERVRRSLEAGLSSLSDCCHIGTGHNYIILPGTMAEFSYLDWTVQCSIVDQCCGSCLGRVSYFQPDPYQPVQLSVTSRPSLVPRRIWSFWHSAARRLASTRHRLGHHLLNYLQGLSCSVPKAFTSVNLRNLSSMWSKQK